MPLVSLPTRSRPYVLIEAGAAAGIRIDSAEIIALYKSHGAILLRGFDFDVPKLREFTKAYCSGSVFNESPDRVLLDHEHNIQTVNGGRDAFPLHPELSREPWKPDVCFFCCLVPPSEGGETTVCDGIEVVNRLPPDVRAGLEEARLMYVQPATTETLLYWTGSATPAEIELHRVRTGCPYRFVRTPSGIMRVFTRPALHKPMFSNALAFGNFLLFARYYLGRSNFPVMINGRPVPEAWVEAVDRVSAELTVAVRWQTGDLLMLDNSRFMHGRHAIGNPQERLIASYFGYLNFAVADGEEPRDAPWRQGAFRPPQAGPRDRISI